MMEPESQSEFDRFRNLVRQVVNVPKADFDREEERLKETLPPVKRGRKAKVQPEPEAE